MAQDNWLLGYTKEEHLKAEFTAIRILSTLSRDVDSPWEMPSKKEKDYWTDCIIHLLACCPHDINNVFLKISDYEEWIIKLTQRHFDLYDEKNESFDRSILQMVFAHRMSLQLEAKDAA